MGKKGREEGLLKCWPKKHLHVFIYFPYSASGWAEEEERETGRKEESMAGGTAAGRRRMASAADVALCIWGRHHQRRRRRCVVVRCPRLDCSCSCHSSIFVSLCSVRLKDCNIYLHLFSAAAAAAAACFFLASCCKADTGNG